MCVWGWRWRLQISSDWEKHENGKGVSMTEYQIHDFPLWVFLHKELWSYLWYSGEFQIEVTNKLIEWVYLKKITVKKITAHLLLSWLCYLGNQGHMSMTSVNSNTGANLFCISLLNWGLKNIVRDSFKFHWY